MTMSHFADFNHLARMRRDLVDAAREWAADCEWADDIDGLSDAEILRGVHRHYAGGIFQLARDSALGQPEGTGR